MNTPTKRLFITIEIEAEQTFSFEPATLQEALGVICTGFARVPVKLDIGFYLPQGKMALDKGV